MAQAWLAAHRPRQPLVLAYDVRRCCGGGKICRATVREQSATDRLEDHAMGVMPDGNAILIHRSAARRLPARFALTVRGLGPLKHLDLALDGEQWGELLYT